jgi:hypothetical protein
MDRLGRSAEARVCPRRVGLRLPQGDEVPVRRLAPREDGHPERAGGAPDPRAPRPALARPRAGARSRGAAARTVGHGAATRWELQTLVVRTGPSPGTGRLRSAPSDPRPLGLFFTHACLLAIKSLQNKEVRDSRRMRSSERQAKRSSVKNSLEGPLRRFGQLVCSPSKFSVGKEQTSRRGTSSPGGTELGASTPACGCLAAVWRSLVLRLSPPVAWPFCPRPGRLVLPIRADSPARTRARRQGPPFATVASLIGWLPDPERRHPPTRGRLPSASPGESARRGRCMKPDLLSLSKKTHIPQGNIYP